jgi:hypothetical protein
MCRFLWDLHEGFPETLTIHVWFVSLDDVVIWDERMAPDRWVDMCLR